MTHELVRTSSGAWAVRSLTVGETMHPGVGPLIEAQRLYVQQSRLGDRLRDARCSMPPWLVLFDVGMGAGSNAVAALKESEIATTSAARLSLVSFERDLGALRLALTQPADFGLEGTHGAAARTLLTHGRHETSRTCWRLEHDDLLAALERQPQPADIVFWDPYSPRVNPSLWTIAAFARIRRAAGPGCTLFTYSASTAVRIAMLLGGWAVGVGDAIGNKAATTAAAVDARDLARPLDAPWLARLSLPDVPLPIDAPTDVIARAVGAPQFNQV